MAHTSISLGAAVTVDGRLLAGRAGLGSGRSDADQRHDHQADLRRAGLRRDRLRRSTTPVCHADRRHGTTAAPATTPAATTAAPRRRPQREEGRGEEGRGEEGQQPRRRGARRQPRLGDTPSVTVDLELHVDLDARGTRGPRSARWLYGLDHLDARAAGCAGAARRKRGGRLARPHGQASTGASDRRSCRGAADPARRPASTDGAARPGCAWSPARRPLTNERTVLPVVRPRRPMPPAVAGCASGFPAARMDTPAGSSAPERPTVNDRFTSSSTLSQSKGHRLSARAADPHVRCRRRQAVDPDSGGEFFVEEAIAAAAERGRRRRSRWR